ncbi:MAG TPA: adenine deaminase [Magnetospirillaceae bacterium]|jgi:adenine deaminase
MAPSRPRRSKEFLAQSVDQALGREPADLVIKNTRFLNIVTGEVAESDIAICGDAIVGTYAGYKGKREIDGRKLTCVPGFVDTHVHVESSLVTPFEFDRCALPRGTTTAICDPHEITNVLGTTGLDYVLGSAANTAMDLLVQLPSCVPATALETSGARLEAADLLPYRDHPKGIGLAEFMNVPGVLNKDPGVMEKLAAFSDSHIDGHAPMVSGMELNAYLSCGIRNCHETTTLDAAWEKLRKGMQVLIREGTVCKDVATLAPALTEQTSSFCAFCTDDRNPLDIHEEGHLDHVIRMAIKHGAPVAHAYRAASWSAARGFGLADRGLIAPGQRADIVLLEDLADCRVHSVVSAGRLVGDELFAGRKPASPVGLDSMKLTPVSAADFATPAGGPSGPVIGVRAGTVVTEHLTLALPYRNGHREADPSQDVLKVCVIARHGKNKNIGRGFVKGFGMKDAALASSIGHDSHNVCVIGADDADMAVAVNRLIQIGGGFVAVRNGVVIGELPLPLAGLVSLEPFEKVADGLRKLRGIVRDLGCTLPEPFLQLAFLPLPVIPHLKITDFGLVDVDRFQLIAA